MIPAGIIISWVGATVTIIGAFTDAQFARISSAVGAGAAILAAVHVSILNSDMHSLFSTLMKPSPSDSKDNPFSGLAENLGTLVANAFQSRVLRLPEQRTETANL